MPRQLARPRWEPPRKGEKHLKWSRSPRRRHRERSDSGLPGIPSRGEDAAFWAWSRSPPDSEARDGRAQGPGPRAPRVWPAPRARARRGAAQAPPRERPGRAAGLGHHASPGVAAAAVPSIVRGRGGSGGVKGPSACFAPFPLPCLPDLLGNSCQASPPLTRDGHRPSVCTFGVAAQRLLLLLLRFLRRHL